jgi:hypothetical protein
MMHRPKPKRHAKFVEEIKREQEIRNKKRAINLRTRELRNIKQEKIRGLNDKKLQENARNC